VATVIAYVGGFKLYHGLRDKYRRRYLWLDLEHLVRLRPQDRIIAVRYFTALVRDDPPSLARQRAYLDALDAHRGTVEIILGRHQARPSPAGSAAVPGPATRRRSAMAAF
jgi:hypothetical protein